MDVVAILTGVVSIKSISINTLHKKLWISSFKTLDDQQRNRFSWGRMKLLGESRSAESQYINCSWKKIKRSMAK
jgi:hypothetical protein